MSDTLRTSTGSFICSDTTYHSERRSDDLMTEQDVSKSKDWYKFQIDKNRPSKRIFFEDFKMTPAVYVLGGKGGNINSNEEWSQDDGKQCAKKTQGLNSFDKIFGGVIEMLNNEEPFLPKLKTADETTASETSKMLAPFIPGLGNVKKPHPKRLEEDLQTKQRLLQTGVEEESDEVKRDLLNRTHKKKLSQVRKYKEADIFWKTAFREQVVEPGTILGVENVLPPDFRKLPKLNKFVAQSDSSIAQSAISKNSRNEIYKEPISVISPRMMRKIYGSKNYAESLISADASSVTESTRIGAKQILQQLAKRREALDENNKPKKSGLERSESLWYRKNITANQFMSRDV
ncbi:hypothetical protein HELRODRAFT_177151 [Helobdella robusta]|uniref:Uncharacterized protein n=1 Tax=Helobdella robusta TaxID=6412 RepID=T1FBA0_HELRO|nr:hypothetical protein HELRODRAFT_177151 [Helobdella robusta]ESN98269.1 hypothetical protein HELRODRAFT_177151 [Helobdella robusta]